MLCITVHEIGRRCARTVGTRTGRVEEQPFRAHVRGCQVGAHALLQRDDVPARV
jgi:hypothetical protein